MNNLDDNLCLDNISYSKEFFKIKTKLEELCFELYENIIYKNSDFEVYNIGVNDNVIASFDNVYLNLAKNGLEYEVVYLDFKLFYSDSDSDSDNKIIILTINNVQYNIVVNISVDIEKDTTFAKYKHYQKYLDNVVTYNIHHYHIIIIYCENKVIYESKSFKKFLGCNQLDQQSVVIQEDNSKIFTNNNGILCINYSDLKINFNNINDFKITKNSKLYCNVEFIKETLTLELNLNNGIVNRTMFEDYFCSDNNCYQFHMNHKFESKIRLGHKYSYNFNKGKLPKNI